MRTVILGVACVLVGVAADALFLRHQSLWNDEATQLAGLSLGPVEVTEWLAGRVHHDFGVPDDRMPPLSYWAGWGWSRAFGLVERPMRWFGVACVALASGIVFVAARRTWGLASGVAASLLLASSPNVIEQAVEIRAYPLMILLSAAVFACLLGHAAGPVEHRRRWLAGMAICGIMAMYTHFFGLVVTGGALVAAFVLALVRGEGLRPVLVAGGATGLAALGLAPFVLASASFSAAPTAPAEGKVVGLVRLGYRLISHPSMSVSRVAVALAAVGFVVAFVRVLASCERSRWAEIALLLALAAGLVVVATAHLATKRFEAATPRYNIWMSPGLALLLGSGLAAGRRTVRAATLAAVLALLAADSYAAAQLAIRGECSRTPRTAPSRRSSVATARGGSPSSTTAARPRPGTSTRRSATNSTARSPSTPRPPRVEAGRGSA